MLKTLQVLLLILASPIILVVGVHAAPFLGLLWLISRVRRNVEAERNFQDSRSTNR